jgi:hypothetical protein
MHVSRLGFVAIALGLAVAGAAPAFAQLVGGGGGGAGATGLGAASQRNLRGAERTPGTPTTAAPPVLPGTKRAPEAAAPTASSADMSPTDSLFDAVNRGDNAAARDAVNRGANLDARNLLGLTPLELSVDLGRNNISFMLMSLRDEGAPARREDRSGLDQRTLGQRIGEDASSVHRVRTVAVVPRAADEPVVATPRFNSGAGGAPNPAAGFLGFGEGRPAR